MDPSLIVAAFSGALVALLLTLFGGGGSVLATPLLLYAVGVKDAHVAIGTSAAAVAANAAVAMAAVGLSMFRAPRSLGDPDVRIDPGRALKLVPIGAATGLAASFFGIGGGFLIAPGLMAATGMTLANAAASSLVSVALFGAATSVSYAVSGFVNGPLFLALIAGGGVGVFVGARLAPRLASRGVLARRIFAVMIVATAGYVFWRAVSGLS